MKLQQIYDVLVSILPETFSVDFSDNKITIECATTEQTAYIDKYIADDYSIPDILLLIYETVK